MLRSTTVSTGDRYGSWRLYIRTDTCCQDFIKRQANVQKGVPVNVAAMTDQAGNVILFDTNGVYKDASAKGL